MESIRQKQIAVRKIKVGEGMRCFRHENHLAKLPFIFHVSSLRRKRAILFMFAAREQKQDAAATVGINEMSSSAKKNLAK